MLDWGAVFGLSFGELCVLLIVAIVVLGPKELPRYLRKAGAFAGRMRRLAYEMREKSGIDEVLRAEGIHQEIAEIRKLARGEIGGVMSAVRSATDAARIVEPAAAPYAAPASGVVVAREREYPTEGPDSYGALPDTAAVYEGSLANSPLADDALYARGESTDITIGSAEQPPIPSASTSRP
jgi:sec-independent protein translocase protein TatB